jgi:hypothetical protein
MTKLIRMPALWQPADKVDIANRISHRARGLAAAKEIEMPTGSLAKIGVGSWTCTPVREQLGYIQSICE